MLWIDTHCHLDAPEFFEPNRPLGPDLRAQAAIKGVAHCVIPAVEVGNFDAVRSLAHAGGDSYCLGIHPLFVKQASESDLATLRSALVQHRSDSRLVGVGEIGLDYFVPELCESPLKEKQDHFYRAQLQYAREFGLPVVLHVRRSVDRIIKHLRDVGRGGHVWSGIAHAFNGSDVQAQALLGLGLKLGFGGAVTFERALRLRHLAQTLPLDSIVLETDAPDIPPQWLYTTARERLDGIATNRNEPGELPRIGAVVAQLRGISLDNLAQVTTQSACKALPKLAALLV